MNNSQLSSFSSNPSFIQWEKILKENGVTNIDFLFKDNIWCYFRDFLLPSSEENEQRLYHLNIGTSAFIHLFSNEIDSWLRLPRQSGTTTTLKLCRDWYNNYQVGSKAIYLSRRINPRMKAKMKQLPTSFKNDIAIVDEAECLSYADYNLIRKSFKHSYFASVVIKDADKRLVKDEDSFQLFTFDMYDNPPTDSKTPILITYPAEMIHDDHYIEFHKVVLSKEHYKSEILLQRD